jgi:squalene-hopene/tetraprenyl-beta-curcumene cyclase
MTTRILPSALAALLATTAALATIPGDLEQQARDAMDRGAAWLAARQQENGAWGMPEAPAMTALALQSLQVTAPEAYSDAIARATGFVLSNAQPDGGIWCPPAPGQRGGGLANYNTAVSLAALHTLGRPDLVPVLQRARTFLAGSQYADGPVRGGIGYDPNQPRPHADLSNSAMVYDAMRATQDLEDLRAAGDPKADLDWDAVQDFLAQVQNLPSVNTNAWASDDPDDKGGFVYTPGAGPARGAGGPRPGGPAGPGRPGMAAPESSDSFQLPPDRAVPPPPRTEPASAPAESAEPKIALRSYGSMTYAGLLSLIYANVSKDDPRVLAAQDWAAKHWTLDENPGQGPEGLYYFYTVLVKCLDAFGDDLVTLPDGTTVAWREAVVRKILSLQHDDGHWVNTNNRWWEADPTLVTSYAILALDRALGE